LILEEIKESNNSEKNENVDEKANSDHELHEETPRNLFTFSKRELKRREKVLKAQ
jgi:hypothetical protein